MNTETISEPELQKIKNLCEISLKGNWPYLFLLILDTHKLGMYVGIIEKKSIRSLYVLAQINIKGQVCYKN